LPRLFGGDEPHYLIIINSLLNDGDIDLANNYEAVHEGSDQAGALWAGHPFKHHSQVIIDGRPYDWREEVYKGAEWTLEPSGAMRPVFRGPTPDPLPPPGAPEYSTHPAAIAYLLYPVLYPLRGTTYVEPAALLCSGLATVAGMGFFAYLLGSLTANRRVVMGVTAVAFLGTPAWFYGRSLFMESFLVGSLVGAYALALRKDWNLLPGILLGCAVQLKPHFALFALPLLVDRAIRRQWRGALGLALPVAASTGLLLLTYARLYGSPFHPPQRFERGDFLTGFTGILWSNRHGLLAFSPVVVVALACWPAFLARQRRYALILGSGVVAFLLLMSCYAVWTGGICYGPRYIVPMLPLLYAALVQLPDLRFARPGIVRAVILALVAVSIFVNARGVFYYSEHWNQNPYESLFSTTRTADPGE
jgi:hypothetical protein